MGRPGAENIWQDTALIDLSSAGTNYSMTKQKDHIQGNFVILVF